MTKLNEIYKCNICGNVVEILHTGAGQLVCCGENMELLDEKKSDEGEEKHLPVLEIEDDLVRVKIGSVPHPMKEKHYIEWIELIADNKVYKKFLNPGDEAMVEFKVKANVLSARAYCNVHGLWKK
jgi:superoxide reductase